MDSFTTGAVFQGELIEETEEGKVFWIPIEELENQKLAPNMETYLKLFFNDNLHEKHKRHLR